MDNNLVNVSHFLQSLINLSRSFLDQLSSLKPATCLPLGSLPSLT
nr:MAG TPA: hypothetical protein [Bacteriophage sp.]